MGACVPHEAENFTNSKFFSLLEPGYLTIETPSRTVSTRNKLEPVYLTKYLLLVKMSF